MFEPLESRRLLAVTVDFTGGILTVTGDAEANRVGIARNLDLGTLFVRSGDAILRSVPYADVTSIRVNLLGGNDRLETQQAVTKPMSISGGEGNDYLVGGGGRDLLEGGPGNDVLRSGGGNDGLNGGDGNDALDGGRGADNLNGGGGVDLLTYAERLVGVVVTLHDNLANDGQPATLGHLAEGDNAHSDIENLHGGRGNDRLSGTDGPNRINGGTGNDAINGSGGNDLLEGGYGNDVISGGGGNDRLFGGPGGDRLLGGEGDDYVHGRDGVRDFLDGGAGNDHGLIDQFDEAINIEVFDS